MGWYPKKKIVVPIDFSELSLDAIPTAVELADNRKNVHLIHVLADLSPIETGEMWRTIDTEMRKKHARQALEERLAERGLSELPIEIAIGEPGRTIAQYAEDIKAELIVLPSHGRTGIKRFLIGSVAERVIRYAHCPVLVLRTS